MRILAFETSAKAASAAILEDDRLLAEAYQNNGQTHSRTVMQLAANLLESCQLTPKDVDLVAYANGPGSFTGVRIGAAAAKGFCWGAGIPCVPVSTLEAMARTHAEHTGTLVCCMDARRSQVYNAVFTVENGVFTRLREDRALSLEELGAELDSFPGPILLVGDGAELAYKALGPAHPGLRLAPEHLRQQRAAGVALAARAAGAAGVTDPGAAVPNYLRLSQAERERLAKQQLNAEQP